MPDIIPGPQDTSRQPDWLAAILRALPQLGPPKPAGFSVTGRQSSGPAIESYESRIPPMLTTSPGAGRREAGAGYASTSFEDQLLRDFIQQLLTPIDYSDPRVATILQQSQSAAAREAEARGIQGGLTVSQQQQAYINTAAQLQEAQRQQAGSLLDSAANRRIRRDEMDYNRFLNEQALKQDQSRSLGGLIGGGLGAGVGIGASILTSGAATPLIPGFISGGSQIGAGIGGAFSQPQSYNPYPTFNKRL